MKGSLLKKGLAALAAFAVGVGGLALGASSANAATPATITLKGAQANHEYAAYRIGSYSEAVKNTAAGKATDMTSVRVTTVNGWAAAVDAAVKTTGKLANNTYPAGYSANDPVAYVASWDTATDGGALRKFVDNLKVTGKTADATSTVFDTPNTQDLTLNVPDEGWYFITDTFKSNDPDLTGTNGVSLLVGTKFGAYESLSGATLGEVDVKPSRPTLDKNIVENKGTDNETLTKKDGASVGDTVNYRLSSTVPSYTGYNTYVYTMTDTLSAGLTFDENTVVVKIGDKTLMKGTDYTLTSKKIAQTDIDVPGSQYTAVDLGKTVVTIAFTDFVTKKPTIGAGVTVDYSATLNDAAVVRQEGNPNEVKLTYSNDPSDGSKTTDTPPVDPVVYTYDFNLKKVDAKGNPVTGAKFKVFAGANAATNGTPLTFTGKAGSYKRSATGAVTELSTDDAEGTNQGTLKFEGFGPGDYTVYESTVPSGFAQIRAKFTVHIADDGAVTFTDNNLGLVTTDNKTENGVTIYYAKVLNVKNITELPLTGAAGTTLFTVIGLLLAGAAVTVYTKSRKTRRDLAA